MSADDATTANLLIRFTLDREARPGTHPEYAELLARYQTDPAYTHTVQEAAKALGLRVLARDEQLGLILDTASDSPFAVKSDELAKDLGWSSAEERVIYGVALVAVAAYCYPHHHSFSVDGVRPVTAVGVDELVRAAAARGTHTEGDESHEDVALADALSMYVGEKSVAYGKDGGLKRDCTVYKVGRALRWLTERGFMVRDVTDRDLYRTNEKFRVHVREVAGHAIFEELSRIAREEDGS